METETTRIETLSEIYASRPIQRTSSVLSNSGVPHRKWTINTQELNSNIMDEERSKFRVYEYLCHVGETKEWMERLLKKELAPISGFENQLQYGVTLAELAKLFSPESVKKIFESEKLQFRHSDNINYFFDALKNIQFPEIFYFELTDCYEKKNMPKVIYCLHALSHVLEFKGYGKAVRDLVGKLEFTDKEVEAQYETLKENNINLPTFNNLENKLQEELQKSTANLIYNDFKKSSDVLDDFVPSKNFYRKGSEISNDKMTDNESLQKQLFKAQYNNRDRSMEISDVPKESEEKPKEEEPKEEEPKEEEPKVEEPKEEPKEEEPKVEEPKEEEPKEKENETETTRSLNEEKEEENTETKKDLQTEVKNTDPLNDFLKDYGLWLILVLVIAVLHALISKDNNGK